MRRLSRQPSEPECNDFFLRWQWHFMSLADERCMFNPTYCQARETDSHRMTLGLTFLVRKIHQMKHSLSSIFHQEKVEALRHSWSSAWQTECRRGMFSPSNEMMSVTALKSLLSQLNFYFGLFIFVFGIVGNILNIFVLAQRPLRSNPCVAVFLASSTAGIIAILSGLTSRVLSGVTVDLSATVNWICKLRGFVLFASRFATFWLIMLATFDRWLLSSVDARRRQMSSMKNALRGIAAIVLTSIVVHSQLFYCYEANLVGTPLKCFTRNFQCRLINDLIFSVAAILVPLLLILVFGLLTISNTRKTRGRVGLSTSTAGTGTHPTPLHRHSIHLHRSKKVDQRLLLMLFIQVILFALFTLPLSIQKLYATFTMNIPKALLRSTIEDFIYQIALICTYFAAGMPFYVNTLSGGVVFKKAMFNLKGLLVRRLLCRWLTDWLILRRRAEFFSNRTIFLPNPSLDIVVSFLPHSISIE